MIKNLVKITLLALSFSALTATAQSYPNRPVKVIIPFPPGGTLDTVGRMLAQKLGEQMGQPFVVENRAGGNGTIGADAVAKASADGYTLLFNASTFVTAPMTMRSVPYSVVKDFAAIALVAKAPLSIAINKNLPITDVKSLLAYAKANPGKMSFAVGSIGSAGHLSTELLKRAGGINYLVVPYKGTAPAFQDLIGGQIDGFIDPILGSLQHHKAGLLRVVAVTSSTRAPNLPEVPTVAETIPGYEFFSWYGLWGPAKLPPEVVAQLNAEVNKALASDMQARLVQQGLLLSPGSTDDFVKFQASDMARAQKIITDGNIRLNRMRDGMQRAIVTGSSSGIGLAIAENLLAGGWAVSGFDIAPARITHAAFEAVEVDLCDEARLAAAVQPIKTHAMIHAAGILRVGKLGQLQASDAQLMWQLHVSALSSMANIIVPHMAAAGFGRVVIIGSRVAQGIAGRSQYAATKAALVSLARSWAAEVVASGVTVNVVSPAATQTAMLGDPVRQESSPRTPPIGRMIEPLEIAALVAYLLSPLAAAITGQNINICGGASLDY